MSRVAVAVVLGLWGLAMALSVLALLEPPTGDGFTRGMNRITGFLGWQFAAGIAAIVLWVGLRAVPKGDPRRWLGRVPGWWSMVLFGLVVLWIGIGLIGAELGRDRAERLAPPPVTGTPGQ